ncbi:MAG TPA: hypothetical protein VFQ00_12460 [Terriglobales bacterium]|nr:hypothetical protein [Terriglobales bacterium]
MWQMLGCCHSALFRRSSLMILCVLLAAPLFATRGMFQGRVVEGTKRELGKFIYVEGPGGMMRRVDIRKCRVRFAPSVPVSERVRNAAEFLHEGAVIRVTADQKQDGEWTAADILILKLPVVDKVRLLV